MLLRRLAGNLRRQEWGVLAIEFVVVVVGIFSGSRWTAGTADLGRASGEVREMITAALQ